MPVENKPTQLSAHEVARRIRDKVADLNDDLLLAALAEVDVEFVIRNDGNRDEAVRVQVWCSQEVR